MKNHIIVTGGAQGIGRETALTLHTNGYAVSIFDNDREALEEMQKNHSSGTLFYQLVDICQENEIQKAVKEAAKHFGNIYGLVNCAAIHANKPIDYLCLEEWTRVLSVNLTGPFLCTKYCKPYLQKSKGRIINISSTRALQSEPNTEAYSASKGGLLALTHALAVSLGPQIKVNAISPGWIDVSAVKKKSLAKQEELTEADHLQHPAGRVGQASDIANMVLFLLLEKNDFITGQNFIVDGGMTRKMIYV